MRMVPGSFLQATAHRDTFSANNLLSRGQEIEVEGRRRRAARTSCRRPGEMSLHHVRMVHGSPPNRSDDRRIGFAVRHIPT